MKRLVVPVAGAAVCAILYDSWFQIFEALGLGFVNGKTVWAHRIVAILFWGLIALAGNRALHIFVWKGWFERRSGIAVPKMLTDLVGMVVWLAAAFLVLGLVFEVDTTGLLTTSGVTIAVIGFALRNMIADVFTGIALGIEKPLRTGDWIELEDGTVGRVAEINWRAARVVTKEEVTKVVPNSLLATRPFTNYHSPDDFFRDNFEITLGYDVTAHQAERILLSAVSQIPESTRIPRKPEVRIIEYLERGIKWELRYWVPDYPSMSTLRYQVQRNVMRNLHYAGVNMPRRAVEYFDLSHPVHRKDEIAEDVGFLRSIELFKSLDTAELGILREKMRRRLCVAGEAVVCQGEKSNASLFVVKEGFLDVTVRHERGKDVAVGWLAPGMFFGENSLLTGEARSATVIPSIDAVLFEITHEDIEPLLQARPDLVRHLSEALADRQMRNDVSLQAASQQMIDDHRQKLTERLFTGIVRFFGLGGEDRPDIRTASSQ